jgi:flagellar biosynthesis activator protein FlaF
MYKLSYAEIMEGDCVQARSREHEALDEAIVLMSEAETKGPGSPEALRAIQSIQRLWAFFIEDLNRPSNELATALRADLISIGLWAIAEADRILGDPSKSFASLIDINKKIRDGLQ